MSFDAHKNFAVSTVATAPSPATSGTSLVVATGDGTKFPAAPFNATVWPASSQPTTGNAEIVRVTAVSTDTFTITRTQEGTSARSIGVGDQIAATITAKTLTDVETASPFGAYATTVIADTPWAYWECQDASGNATDSSGNSRTATAAGSPTYHQTGPGPGALNLFAFGASGASTAFNASGNPGLTNNFTIEIWAYLSSYASRALWTSATGGNHFNLDIGSTNDFGVIVQGVAAQGRSNGRLLINRWNQIVVTRGSSNPTGGADNNWRYYLNGQPDNMSAGTSSPGGAQTGNFGFGGSVVSGDRFAHCSVLNNKVLGSGEVLERYMQMRFGP